MKSYKKVICLCMVAMLGIAVVCTRAEGADPYGRPKEGYLKGWAEMGKAAAAYVTAQATMIKAMADANACNAKAMETLEKTRSQTLDNDLKTAKTFYEKRNLHETHLAQNARTRPTHQDLIRYSKQSLPERPTNYHVEPVRGRIHWPAVLQEEQFSEYRVELDGLFAKRATTDVEVDGETSQQIQEVVERMQAELSSLVRQVNPGEYLAARKFIESLAFETRFPKWIEGVATN